MDGTSPGELENEAARLRDALERLRRREAVRDPSVRALLEEGDRLLEVSRALLAQLAEALGQTPPPGTRPEG